MSSGRFGDYIPGSGDAPPRPPIDWWTVLLAVVAAVVAAVAAALVVGSMGLVRANNALHKDMGMCGTGMNGVCDRLDALDTCCDENTDCCADNSDRLDVQEQCCADNTACCTDNTNRIDFINTTILTLVHAQVLAHTVSGVIPPTHRFQTLQGAGVYVPPPTPSFAPTAYPFDALPLGALANGATASVAPSLVIKAASDTVSVITVAGHRVVQMGEPEPVFGVGDPNNDQVPPFNRQTVQVDITIGTLPSGAAGVAYDLYVEASSEPGFDFVRTSGPVSIPPLAGVGPSPASGYVSYTATNVQHIRGQLLTITFAKDPAAYDGYDNARIVVRNARPIALPPVAPPGAAGLNMVLPASLTSYVGTDIHVCSLDANQHTLNLTTAGMTWDVAGTYPEARFLGTPCCVVLTTTAPNRVAITSGATGCVAYCRQGGLFCTSATRELARRDAFLTVSTPTVVLPPTHSTIEITAGSSAFIAIPCDDLTQYIGRRFLVTSRTAVSHSIGIAKGTAVCNAQFQVGPVTTLNVARATVLKMDAVAGASVEFYVVSAGVIAVTSNRNARICDADGNCAHIGDELSAFGGWWVAESDALALDFSPASAEALWIESLPYLNGGTTLRIVKYTGPPGMRHRSSTAQVRTFNPADFTKTEETIAILRTPFEISFASPANFFVRMAAIDPANPDRMMVQGPNLGPAATVQITLAETDFGNSWNPPYAVYRRVGAPQVGSADRSYPGYRLRSPPLMPIDTPDRIEAGVNFRDRRVLFDYYVGIQMNVYNQGVFIEKPVRCTGVSMYPEALALAERLKTETITKTVNVVRVQRTNTPRGLTTVELDASPDVTAFSDVEIAGVAGVWSAINGRHRIARGRDTPFAYGPGDVDTASIHWFVYIDFNSTGFPADPYTGWAYVNGTMTVAHGPVTADAEYKPFMDAVHYFDTAVFPGGTHHFMATAANGDDPDPNRVCLFTHETWADVEYDVDNDPNGLHLGGVVLTRAWQRSLAEETPMFYVNGRGRSGWRQLFGDSILPCALNVNFNGFMAMMENDPSGVTNTPLAADYDTPAKVLADPGTIHVPLENYLERASVHYFGWKTEGAPSPTFFGEEIDASFLYPPYDGSTGGYLVGVPVPYDETPANSNVNIFNDQAPLNGLCSDVGCNGTGSYYEWVRDNDPLAWQMYRQGQFCGIVNRSYTSGKTIAYCYFANTRQNDPLGLTHYRNMAPPGLDGPSNVRARREAFSAILASMMQLLFDGYGATDVIFDIRYNGGGDAIVQSALAEFFGTHRAAPTARLYRPHGDGTQVEQDFDNLFDPYNLKTLLYTPGDRSLFPELNEAYYPGSTMAGGNIYMISSPRAGSGGDLFPQAFVSPAMDGNLGAGTQFSTSGNPVGTLFGCNGSPGQRLPATPDSFVMNFTSFFEWTWQGLFISVDRFCSNVGYADGVTSSCHKAAAVYPAPLASLPGNDGGNAPPHDTETLLWPDIGYVFNPRPRLSGDTRPQTPTQRSEWRDAWLEATVDNIVGAKRRRGDDAELAQHAARIQEARAAREAARQKRTDTVYADAIAAGYTPCTNATTPPALLPRRTIATMHYGHEDMGTSGLTFTIDGRPATRMDVHAALYEFNQKMKEAGATCVQSDGRVAYTPAATAVPHIARDIDYGRATSARQFAA